MNRLLFTLHKWLGLVTGIFLLAIGVSGSFLVYSRALDRMFYPELYSIEPQGTRLSLDSIYSMIYRKYGTEFGSCSFDIPSTENERVEFTLNKPQTNYYDRGRYLVDMHPYTGAILREGSSADMSVSFVHWVMYFHNSFHSGRIGMLIVTVVSVTLLLSIITGLFFYGKRFTRVTLFRLPLGGKEFYRSLHLYVGVWSLVFTTVVCFTGFWMMKGTLSYDAWRIDPPGQKTPLSVSIDSCLAASRTALPGFIPDFVSIPFTSGELIGIDGNMANTPAIGRGDACSVTIDPASGKVLEANDVAQAWFPGNISAYVWPLHIGNYGGNLLKILYVIGGLMPGVLWISGFVMWRRASNKK